MIPISVKRDGEWVNTMMTIDELLIFWKDSVRDEAGNIYLWGEFMTLELGADDDTTSDT